MKLQCQVETINRLHSNLNIRTTTKYLKSTLALGKEVKSETEFFILHFSTVNKTGTKYRVKNIKQVFVRCISEGKATLRFEEPPHDLCIKSESLQLKCFMRLLKLCMTGETKDLQISQLANISITSKDTTPRKLVISDRSQFPSKGLPRTLESLYINGLKLCNFRRDILLLKQLTILDLSNNEIVKLPSEFSCMPSLNELYLANNQLGIKGKVDWSWLLGNQILNTLKLLDLSNNHLVYLPKAIWKLQKLVTLKIDKNSISELPASLGRISSLRFFTASHNNLKTLPCSIMQCRLDYIDLSSNKFHTHQKILNSRDIPLWDLYVGSLTKLSSMAVLKCKLYYASNLIPWTLVEFLDNANMCICGTSVVNDFFITKEYQIKDVFNTVVFDNNRECKLSFNCYFCSTKCFRNFAR